MRTSIDFARIRHVAVWAAEECDRQRSGELSVGRMVSAWAYAVEHIANHPGALPDEDDIRILGAMVEPTKAGDGYRKVNVRVGTSVKGPWQDVGRLMTQLVGFLTDPEASVEPGEWFRQYEEIHPFADGNGRTGSILFNWLRGSLDWPVEPPDFWADDREPPLLWIDALDSALRARHER